MEIWLPPSYRTTRDIEIEARKLTELFWEMEKTKRTITKEDFETIHCRVKNIQKWINSVQETMMELKPYSEIEER